MDYFLDAAGVLYLDAGGPAIEDIFHYIRRRLCSLRSHTVILVWSLPDPLMIAKLDKIG
ncbi:hypothetical protein GCM10018952_08520 [Streptosporangium vulgare]